MIWFVSYSMTYSSATFLNLFARYFLASSARLGALNSFKVLIRCSSHVRFKSLMPYWLKNKNKLTNECRNYMKKYKAINSFFQIKPKDLRQSHRVFVFLVYKDSKLILQLHHMRHSHPLPPNWLSFFHNLLHSNHHRVLTKSIQFLCEELKEIT